LKKGDTLFYFGNKKKGLTVHNTILIFANREKINTSEKSWSLTLLEITQAITKISRLGSAFEYIQIHFVLFIWNINRLILGMWLEEVYLKINFPMGSKELIQTVPKGQVLDKKIHWRT